MEATTIKGLLAVLGIYALIAYIIWFVIGWQNGKYQMGQEWLDWWIAVWWPVSLPLILIWAIGEYIESWARRHRQASRQIARVFDLLTLPLRPGSFGKRIAEWLKEHRSHRAKEGKGNV